MAGRRCVLQGMLHCESSYYSITARTRILYMIGREGGGAQNAAIAREAFSPFTIRNHKGERLTAFPISSVTRGT